MDKLIIAAQHKYPGEHVFIQYEWIRLPEEDVPGKTCVSRCEGFHIQFIYYNYYYLNTSNHFCIVAGRMKEAGNNVSMKGCT